MLIVPLSGVYGIVAPLIVVVELNIGIQDHAGHQVLITLLALICVYIIQLPTAQVQAGEHL